METVPQVTDAWMIQRMRNLAYLDVGNDRRHDARIWYGMTRRSGERGELTAEQWAAYHETYEDELRRQRQAPAVTREAPEVEAQELEEEAAGFVWGAGGRLK
jgi:hypothetical protein